jgi:hypothetical protein
MWTLDVDGLWKRSGYGRLWIWMVSGRGVDMVDFGFGWSLEEEWMQHSRIRPTWMKKQQYKGFQPVVEVNQLFFCVLNRG